MIIRHKHKGRFSIVPNGIFHDPRLSLPAKGLLVYLLSLPPDWEVRHDHLQDKLRIGRKLLESAFKEIIAAGYAVRDEIQDRDEHHRFTTLNYVVSDVSSRAISDVPFSSRSKPKRRRSSGNNKERVKTELTNTTLPKSLPIAPGRKVKASRKQYTEMGNRAVAAGLCAVFVGSEPYEAWRKLRGEDGMPGFIDRVVIDGRLREVVWMPSLYPPGRAR
jgi:hypothetical protein